MASEMLAPLAALKDILATGEYSDLILKCGNREFKVHKNIVCSQSKPIAAAMNPQFTEGSTGIFEFHDDDLLNIEKMIHFLYTGSYQVSNPKIKNDIKPTGSSITESVCMYILGDKWDISALRSKAESDFCMALRSDWDLEQFIVCVGLIYSELPSSSQALKKIAMERAGNSEEIVDQILASDSYAAVCDATQQVQMGNDLLRAYRQSVIDDKKLAPKGHAGEAPRFLRAYCERCKKLQDKERVRIVDGVGYRCFACFYM